MASIYATGEARASRAPWTASKGETKVSYHITSPPSLLEDLTTNIQKVYGDGDLREGCYDASSRAKGVMERTI